MLFSILFLGMCRIIPARSLDATHADPSTDYIACIKHFCNYYFRSEHAMKGSLVIMNVTPDPSPFQSHIIKSLNEDAGHEFSVMIKDSLKKHMNASHVSEKAQNYFMFIVTHNDVNSTVHQWRSLPTWNPLAQVLVLFTETYSADRLENETRNVLEKLLSYRMLNVNVMAHREGSDIMQMVTWFPYANGNCAQAVRELVTMDQCEYRPTNETEMEAIYVPKTKVPKIPATMHGCELTVSSSVFQPYTYYDTEKEAFTKGIEVLLIYTIAKVLHLRPTFVMLNETRENRPNIGLPEGFMQLINRTTDIVIGGMDEDSSTRRFLSSTIPYYQDDQTWCVAVAKPQDLWKSIFNLFSLYEWLGIISIIYMFAAILYVIIKIDNRIESFHWTLLASLSITMGLSTVYDPRKISIRFMFCILLFYGLVFSSAFHSFLVNVLTNPRQKPQVDSLEVAIGNHFQYKGGTIPLAHYRGSDQVSTAIRASYQLCPDLDECLQTLRNFDNVAVSVSREHALNSPVIAKTELFCFAKMNNVYSYAVAMMTQKNFHLLGRMNSIIRRVMEFGLIQKWEKDSDVMQQLKLKIGSDDSDEDEGLVVLTVGHIAGAMILMGVGYALALLTFIAELVVNCKMLQAHHNWLWRLCDRFLDAQRYFLL